MLHKIYMMQISTFAVIYSKYSRLFYCVKERLVIASQDSCTKQRIKKAIEGLTKIPPIGDIKPLQGYTIRTYRLRVGKYRILYRYNTDTNEQRILFISNIDSRGNIYK